MNVLDIEALGPRDTGGSLWFGIDILVPVFEDGQVLWIKAFFSAAALVVCERKSATINNKEKIVRCTCRTTNSQQLYHRARGVLTSTHDIVCCLFTVQY